jgi:DNA-binding PadR family transcriptional regulator
MLRFVLLALLIGHPRHGYDLKMAFEGLFAGAWPLNIGQVYTTLSRLERDGLVTCEVVEQDLLPDRKVFTITDAGRELLASWLREPVSGPVQIKDEILVKLAVHLELRTDSGDLRSAQHAESLQLLGELTRLRLQAGLSPATDAILEGAILKVEAELRWLQILTDREQGPPRSTRRRR